MKNIALKVSGIFLVGLMVISCSKSDTTSLSTGALKDAITVSSQNLNNAVTDIVTSKAFDLLSISSTGSMLKSGTVYSANIPLDLIKGVYTYTPVKTATTFVEDYKANPLIKYFAKTTDNSKMIINMPVEKLKNPRFLRVYLKSDSTLTNNFTMTVSDYHNNYNSYHDYDYVNVANIVIDKANAGDLNIKSVVSPTTGTQYASSFAFANGYTAKYAYASGDTTKSSFAITKGTATLYAEQLLTIKKDTGRFGREQQYSLTIGDVKLVRKEKNTYEVYVKGVLQSKATVAMVDKESSTEPSVCHKREIQITFEDGTTATISGLIGKSIDNISTLFTALHEVYFAAYVADWLGYDVYYKR